MGYEIIYYDEPEFCDDRYLNMDFIAFTSTITPERIKQIQLDEQAIKYLEESWWN